MTLLPVQDPALVPLLTSHKVHITAVGRSTPFWLHALDLLFNALPVLILLSLFFLGRQAARQQQGIVGIGQSHARLYTEERGRVEVLVPGGLTQEADHLLQRGLGRVDTHSARLSPLGAYWRSSGRLVSGNHLLLDAAGSTVVVAVATGVAARSSHGAAGINRQFAALPLNRTTAPPARAWSRTAKGLCST